MRSASVAVDCARSDGGVAISKIAKQSAAEQNATGSWKKGRLVYKLKSSRKIGWD
jgi:hypothetical protein